MAETKKFITSKQKISGYSFSKLETLEARILLDAAAVVTLADVTDGSTTEQAKHVQDALEQAENVVSEINQQVEDVSHEIVFIDSEVNDYQRLVASINDNVEVFVLDARRDGVVQIAEVLANYDNVSAIHILSHGSQAELQLGSGALTQKSMEGEHQDILQAMAGSLSTNADILIYGCNFGQGNKGLVAGQLLADLTGADVAASDDFTGSSLLGADWDLEVNIGDIDSALVFNPTVLHSYQYLLADTPTVTTTNISASSGETSISLAGKLDVSISDSDGDTNLASINKIVISNLPDNATLSKGSDLGDGAWQLNRSDFDTAAEFTNLTGVTLNLAQASNSDINLTVAVTATEATLSDAKGDLDTVMESTDINGDTYSATETQIYLVDGIYLQLSKVGGVPYDTAGNLLAYRVDSTNDSFTLKFFSDEALTQAIDVQGLQFILRHAEANGSTAISAANSLGESITGTAYYTGEMDVSDPNLIVGNNNTAIDLHDSRQIVTTTAGEIFTQGIHEITFTALNDSNSVLVDLSYGGARVLESPGLTFPQPTIGAAVSGDATTVNKGLIIGFGAGSSESGDDVRYLFFTAQDIRMMFGTDLYKSSFSGEGNMTMLPGMFPISMGADGKFFMQYFGQVDTNYQDGRFTSMFQNYFFGDSSFDRSSFASGMMQHMGDFKTAFFDMFRSNAAHSSFFNMMYQGGYDNSMAMNGLWSGEFGLNFMQHFNFMNAYGADYHGFGAEQFEQDELFENRWTNDGRNIGIEKNQQADFKPLTIEQVTPQLLEQAVEKDAEAVVDGVKPDTEKATGEQHAFSQQMKNIQKSPAILEIFAEKE